MAALRRRWPLGLVLQQRALPAGRYAEAAELREKLREAKERTDAAPGRRSAQAEAVAPRRFRLGQRVTHAVHGYRGVICGRALQLCENAKHAFMPATSTVCVSWAACLTRKHVKRGGKACFKGVNATHSRMRGWLVESS